jgi:histidinol-phosphate aminotransferase
MDDVPGIEMTESLRNHLDLAAPGVRGLRPYEPGKPLSELEREYGIRDAVKLASNENPLGASPLAIEAAMAAATDLARYPDGGGFALTRALARKHGVDPQAVTLGNGSNDVLEMVARAFLGPGYEAVFSAHAFAVYPIVTQAVGATARVAQATDGQSGQPYAHDLEAMAALVGAATRVVFLANPNNPTGTWLQAEDLERFISSMPGHVLVVVDEAYFEYVSAPEYPNCIPWIAQHPNLIVTRTFSKAYGLAGLRVGYGVSRPEVADLLNRVRQPFNVNMIAQAAALAALEDAAHLHEGIRINREGMVQLTNAFARMGLSWIESAGNFVCVDVGRPAAAVYEDLLRAGVIVRPVASYGLPQHLRITVGLPAENARLIAALEKVLG